MNKFFRRLALGVLGGVLVIAPSVSAQTTDESGQSYVGESSLAAPDPTNAQIDLVFTPIAPCRIVDTRVAGGPIGAGLTRPFFVSGAAGFTAQGGTSGGCGIPVGAVAAVLNYVAVAPQGPGDLIVTPFPTPASLTSVLNYAPVFQLNIANGVATKICISGCTSGHINATAHVSATDLVVDVMGFYRDVSCQPGTVKLLGQCVETALRAADTIFGASDTCRATVGGGWLLTGLQLRSIRGNVTLAAGGEWADSVYVDSGSFVAVTVNSSAAFVQVGTLTPRPFRCAFRSLP